MRFPIKSIKDELNYRKKLLNDPLFAQKHKTLAQDLGLAKPVNSAATGPQPPTVPTSAINDPLKQQVDAEMKFASYQFSQGMEIEKNGAGPQTAADQQNLTYAHDHLQNPNRLNTPEPWNPAPAHEPWNPAPAPEPYNNPLQPLYPGRMGPLY